MFPKIVVPALAVLSLAVGASQAQNVFVLPGANSTTNNVAVLSSQFTQIGNVAAGAGGFQIFSKPDGSKYYIVSNSSTQTVTVVDNLFQNPRSLGSLGAPATAAALTPNGQRLLVVAGTLHVFDTNSDTDLTPTGILPGTPLTDIALSLDGSRAFLLGSNTSGQGVLYAVDLTGGNFPVVGNLALNNITTGVAAAPNGLIYVSGVNRLYEIIPATLAFTPGGEIALIARAGKPAFTPDGRYALIPNQAPGSTGASLILLDLALRQPVASGANLATSIIDRILVASNSVAYGYSSSTNSIFQIGIPGLAIGATNFPSVPVLNVTAAALSNDVPVGTRGTAQYAYVLAAGTLYRIDLATNQVTGTSQVPAGQGQAIVATGAAIAGASPVSIITYGDRQTIAAAGTSLPLVARVLDANGNPISGVQVTFASVAPGLTISNPTVTTAANGYAVTTVSGGSGPVPITATAGAVTATYNLTFGGSGATGGPATGGLSIVAGQGQVLYGNFGTNGGFGTPLTVKVVDVNGAPVVGTPVAFAVSSASGIPGSGGTLTIGPVGSAAGPTPDNSGFIVNTDSNGQASVNFLASAVVSGGFIQSNVQASAPGTNSVNFFETSVPLNPPPTARANPNPGTVLPSASSGSTVKGALTVAFVSVLGQGIPNVGIRLIDPRDPGQVANAPLVDSSAVACADPTGNGVLTDQTGLATCDLVIKAGPGTYQFGVNVGYAQTIQLYTITVTPGQPAAVKVLQGNNQSGRSGAQLPQAFVVQITDASGNPLANAPVSFQILSPNTISLRNVSTSTDANGQASALGTLGTTAGTYQIRVTSGTGTANVSYTVSIPASGIQAQSGANQSTLVGSAFSSPLVVKVVDASGAPVAGVQVTFSVSSGAATLSSSSVTTDANGLAQTTVNAGTAAGPIVVTATATGGLSTSFSLTSRLPGPTNVTLVNGASFQPGIAPGSIVTIRGLGLLPGISGQFDAFSFFGGPLPLNLRGFSVTFNGYVAPIYSISNQNGQEQVTVQVPYEVTPGNATVVINAVGGGTVAVTVPVQQVAPAFFESTYTGQNFAAAIRQSDGSYITPTNPAHPGDVVCLFANGLGQASPTLGTNASGLPSQNVLDPLDVGLNNGGVRLVSATTLVGDIGVYLVCLQVPTDTATGPRQPVGLILHDPSMGDVFAPGTFIPIQ